MFGKGVPMPMDYLLKGLSNSNFTTRSSNLMFEANTECAGNLECKTYWLVIWTGVVLPMVRLRSWKVTIGLIETHTPTYQLSQ